jgi:hypothetical protein
MLWIRCIFIALNYLLAVISLFTRHRRGQFEISNLLHFRSAASASPDVAMVDAATSACAVWQIVGCCLVILFHASAWHLLWWPFLGLFGLIPFGKWLVLKIYGP